VSLDRDTDDWASATTGLDALNDQIWSTALGRPPEVEDLGNGVDAEIDTRPEEDLAFHTAAIARLRQAVKRVSLDRLRQRSAGRLSISEQAMADSLRALDLAQKALRDRDAGATVDGRQTGPASIAIVVWRNGAAA
jgi:hypothetical protein